MAKNNGSLKTIDLLAFGSKVKSMYAYDYDYETDSYIDFGRDFGEEADEAYERSREEKALDASES